MKLLLLILALFSTSFFPAYSMQSTEIPTADEIVEEGTVVASAGIASPAYQHKENNSPQRLLAQALESLAQGKTSIVYPGLVKPHSNRPLSATQFLNELFHDRSHKEDI